MGATWSGYYGARPKTMAEKRDLCRSYFEFKNEDCKCFVIVDTIKRGAYYAVCEMVHKFVSQDGFVVFDSERFVIASPCWFERDAWGIKPESENMGPISEDCPLSYFKLAPNPFCRDAKEWRKRCIEKAKNKKGALCSVTSCSKSIFSSWKP